MKYSKYHYNKYKSILQRYEHRYKHRFVVMFEPIIRSILYCTVDVCYIKFIEIENNCKIAISSQCVRKFHSLLTFNQRSKCHANLGKHGCLGAKWQSESIWVYSLCRNIIVCKQNNIIPTFECLISRDNFCFTFRLKVSTNKLISTIENCWLLK